MRLLIAYSDKNGTSKKTAELLKAVVGTGDLWEIGEKEPDAPENYDILLVGGSIRMGGYNKKLKKFLKTNAALLASKKTGYFINCAFPENRDEHFERNIPENLRNSAFGLYCFGGEMDIAKLKGSDKMIASMVARQTQGSGRPSLSLDEKAIESCGQTLKAMLADSE